MRATRKSTMMWCCGKQASSRFFVSHFSLHHSFQRTNACSLCHSYRFSEIFGRRMTDIQTHYGGTSSLHSSCRAYRNYTAHAWVLTKLFGFRNPSTGLKITFRSQLSMLKRKRGMTGPAHKPNLYNLLVNGFSFKSGTYF